MPLKNVIRNFSAVFTGVRTDRVQLGCRGEGKGLSDRRSNADPDRGVLNTELTHPWPFMKHPLRTKDCKVLCLYYYSLLTLTLKIVLYFFPVDGG